MMITQILAIVLATTTGGVKALPGGEHSHGGHPSPSPNSSPNSAPPVKFQGREIQNLLAFGDSYTYVQGTEGHWQSTFIADAFNASYTPEELLTDEIQLNLTSSGGANWVEYLTGCRVGLPNQCPGVKLWDFAFGGSDITSDLLPLHHNYTVPLVDQISNWDEYARDVIDLNPSETLVAIWIGINDAGDSTKLNLTIPIAEFYDELIDDMFNSVELIYSRGYRNFLFMLLPPLERCPANLIRTPSIPTLDEIVDWDEIMTEHVNTFKANHTNSKLKTYTFDTYNYLTYLLDNYEQFGFTNITGYCANSTEPDVTWNYEAYGCLPINEYFWFNSGHITWPVHRLIAEELRRVIA